MALTTKSDTILLMDDEPFNIQWLIDYLESKNYNVILTSNADSAIDEVSKEIYRATILDLNVPMPSDISPNIGNRRPIYQRYPGLYVAWYARNQGYRDRQVIIYSVHRDQEVSKEAEALGCTYILKGRPRELKSELTHVLSYDPTQIKSENE